MSIIEYEFILGAVQREPLWESILKFGEIIFISELKSKFNTKIYYTKNLIKMEYKIIAGSKQKWNRSFCMEILFWKPWIENFCLKRLADVFQFQIGSHGCILLHSYGINFLLWSPSASTPFFHFGWGEWRCFILLNTIESDINFLKVRWSSWFDFFLEKITSEFITPWP